MNRKRRENLKFSQSTTQQTPVTHVTSPFCPQPSASPPAVAKPMNVHLGSAADSGSEEGFWGLGFRLSGFRVRRGFWGLGIGFNCSHSDAPGEAHSVP